MLPVVTVFENVNRKPLQVERENGKEWKPVVPLISPGVLTSPLVDLNGEPVLIRPVAKCRRSVLKLDGLYYSSFSDKPIVAPMQDGTVIIRIGNVELHVGETSTVKSLDYEAAQAPAELPADDSVALEEALFGGQPPVGVDAKRIGF